MNLKLILSFYLLAFVASQSAATPSGRMVSLTALDIGGVLHLCPTDFYTDGFPVTRIIINEVGTGRDRFGIWVLKKGFPPVQMTPANCLSLRQSYESYEESTHGRLLMEQIKPDNYYTVSVDGGPVGDGRGKYYSGEFCVFRDGAGVVRYLNSGLLSGDEDFASCMSKRVEE